MAISNGTVMRYLHVSKSLVNEFLKSHDGFDPLEFADWLVVNKANLSAATWRHYRSASNFYVSQNFPEVADKFRGHLSRFSSKNKHTGASREKSKSYSQQQLDQMLGRLIAHAQKGGGACHAEYAYLYIKCGDLVGVRPCEWVGASVDHNSSGVFLAIMSAKITNGRSHSDTRSIDIGNLYGNDIEDIKRLILLVNAVVGIGGRGSFMSHYDMVRAVILKQNNELFPGCKKTFSVYTTRHQVTSDLKNNGVDPESIAALMGHGSVDTHREHYGRKSKRGRSRKSLPKASPEDIKAVLQHPSNKSQLNDIGFGMW